MKKLLTIALMLLTMQQAFAKEKISLKVLYVGYKPEKPMPADVVYYSTSATVVAKMYQTRMADFKAFLETRFQEVKTVDVRDYTAEMSNGVDVTIMDAGPVKLPADFSCPMILMHAMAPNVGLPIGLKFDWYCQCLDDEALNIKTTHAIFNAPNKVKLTMQNKPTPGSFFNGHQGAKTPKSMPMWQVVKGDLPAGQKYLIGMVSHGEGFEDSPDAEVISGGVCLKNAEAVALGRQGNYFMWGFSGSPDYMTDEAKDVFVNTVCYIKKYDHKPAIVKKVQIETRTSIDEKIYRISRALYDKAIVSRKVGNERLLKLQKELRDKKDAGEDIGKGNEQFLKMPVTNAMESFEDYLKTQAGDALFAKFGTNTALYHQYFRENYEYFYPANAYALQLDADAAQMKTSNRKPAILEHCITMLERKQDEAMARRVLLRYTNESFATAAEWRNWFNTNKQKLFFTEAAGFKFIVNTFGESGQQNKSASVSLTEKTSAQIAGPTIEDPVAVSAKMVYGQNSNTARLYIDAAILKGWHTYALLPDDSPFIPVKVLLELPEGVSIKGEWQSSPSVPFPGYEGVFIFEDKVTFSIELSLVNVKSGSAISCGMSYQTCDENKCFPPSKKMVDIKI
jgi:hypothetical protein